jgi:hypothetical protein
MTGADLQTGSYADLATAQCSHRPGDTPPVAGKLLLCAPGELLP